MSAKAAMQKSVTTISEAEGLLAEAVSARRAHEAIQGAARKKLSLAAWCGGLLAFSGSGLVGPKKFREERERTPHLFVNASAYGHEVSELVRQDHWRSPGAGATPTTAGADKRSAEIETSRVGVTLYDVIIVELEELAARAPSAFGPIDDEQAYTAERVKIASRAREALEAFASAPERVLVALAWSRAVEYPIHREPEDWVRRRDFASLARRLVDHEMNAAPPARPPGGKSRDAEASNETVFLGGRRYEG
jgi:hypothetical protein